MGFKRLFAETTPEGSRLNLKWLPRLEFQPLLICFLLGASAAQADESFWTELSPGSARVIEASRPVPLPTSYRAFEVELQALGGALEQYDQARGAAVNLALPHPDGGFQRFDLRPSSVMSAELAAKFPEIRAFKGRASADKRTTVQLELTPRGVTAQILAPGGRWMIDPVQQGRPDTAISYRAEHTHTAGREWKCDLHAEHEEEIFRTARQVISSRSGVSAAREIGQSLRTYRLTVAATGEYSQYHGTTTNEVLSAITTTVARVAGIYEKELAVSFTLIADTADIIFLDPATDPFTNPGDQPEGVTYSSQLLGEGQKEITDRIGSANFDIGHVVSTGSGGVAGLGVVCQDSGNASTGAEKARGMTGRTHPIGDAFDVDYVAHEIGHQFGGNHTYNGTVCTTGNPSTAYEPGSGSTIQAYAGICGSDNLQANSDPIFSAASFDEMIAYVEDEEGASCGSSATLTNSTTSATNNIPVVNAGADYTVPNNTPLVLSGSATDSDGDDLTYLWEQGDLGPKVALGSTDNGYSPLFRVWTPSSEGTRYLPKLATVVGGIQTDDEIMPYQARSMDFRLTVRDSEGGVSSDDIVVNVVQSPEGYPPFSVIEPSAGGETLGSTATVRWNVAGTYDAPISTEMVDFYLSTDSGATFSTVPFDSKPNIGYARVTFPAGIQTSTARLIVIGQDNIFYDVSNADFTLDSDAAETPETPTPRKWSLVPTNGGAELYFGEGYSEDGVTAGIFQAECRGESLDAYSESQSPGSAITESQPQVTSTITINAVGSVPAAGLSLSLDVDYPYRGLLSVTLTSPAGTTVTIKDRDIRDSTADVTLNDYTIGGFAGQSLQGDWTLTVTDTIPGYFTGTLQSWALTGNGRTSESVSGSRDRSPIALTGMTNGMDYACELTAFDNTVVPTRGSQTVIMGDVTPTNSPTTYTVTPSAGAGGSISPDTALPVTSGTSLSLTVAADQGYQVDSVGGTCGGNFSRSTYTTNAILNDCTVVASFSPRSPGTPNIDRTDYGDGEIVLYVSATGVVNSYTASCTDGTNTLTGTASSSPVTVSGLTNGVGYTCTVVAENAYGSSAASSATSSITPEATSGLPVWLLYQATQ